jgi:acetylornithine/N-succinyldiaminopimelate aminotransferase
MMGTYPTPPLALQRGSGARVWDAEGRSYLDLIAGIAVSSLGHAHPALLAAVRDQVGRIAHTSNLYANAPALALAERLVSLFAPDARVFFSNDGASANEAAIKIARKYGGTARPRFVAAERSFHGRTLGALALTGKPAIRQPFGPFGLEVTFVPYGDPVALAASVDSSTAAVFLEPTLGEAGVVPPPAGYLAAARAACDRSGALLVLDEVQSGIGRTGAWFAHQTEHVLPDVLTLAKGLGGGLPIGACLARGAAADVLARGDHGSTFGGNPVSAAAALAVLDTIEHDGLLAKVAELGRNWREQLAGMLPVRGAGLWLALEVPDGTAGAFEQAAREAGFLVNAVAPDAVRLAPPLVVSAAELSEFAAALPGLVQIACQP